MNKRLARKKCNSKLTDTLSYSIMFQLRRFQANDQKNIKFDHLPDVAVDDLLNANLFIPGPSKGLPKGW